MYRQSDEKRWHKSGAILIRRQRTRYLGEGGWTAAARVGALEASTLVLDGYGNQCMGLDRNMDKDTGGNVSENQLVVEEVAFPHCPEYRSSMNYPVVRLTVPRHYR